MNESGLPGVLIVAFQLLGSDSFAARGDAAALLDLDMIDALQSWATVTDSDGFFRMSGIPVGFDYAVVQYDLPGYNSTTPNVILVSIPPSAVGTDLSGSFGDWRTTYLYFPLVSR